MLGNQSGRRRNDTGGQGMTGEIARPITDFRRFVGGLREARADTYVGLPHARVESEEEFRRLQAHLVKYYEGVEPVHTFLDTAGKVFDCIPVEQQLSLRGVRGQLPHAPPLPGADEPPAGPIDPIGLPAVQLHARFTDPLGNQMLAPRGTIPIQRLTLADAARFRDLTMFLDREEAERQAAAPEAEAAKEFRQYAAAEQIADTLGGGATLSVWSPAVTGIKQMMSLGQVWFQGGPEATKQTVEAGWQVNPWRYGHTRPILFTYWTADAYRTTGCYNLTCSGFVQTSGDWMLGGAFPLWSTSNGAQVELRFSYLLHDGRWWLYLDDEPLGFFPATLFNGGPLAQAATRMVFGGEVCTSGRDDFPPMGSGAITSPVWGEVAYQRRIRYFPVEGRSRNAKLTELALPRRCYAPAVVRYKAPWNETIWYGGPGGALCA